MANRRAPRRPALTEEGREAQLVSAAIDLAERQIQDGTASAQVITHFLKLGSPREQLERQRIHYENELLQARVEAIASQQRVEALYGAALDAMRQYAGQVVPTAELEEGEYDDPGY